MSNIPEHIKALSKEQLEELLVITAKNELALDGHYFQNIERRWGMDAAMDVDVEVWARFTETEAFRIKKFLNLPEHPGPEGLKRAFLYRFYGILNTGEMIIEGDDTFIYRTTHCIVQNARAAKGMPWHPCKLVGVVEWGKFAKVIDDRFELTECSCYPEKTDDTCACSWTFKLKK
ncbi:MAG: hypothetical protein IKT31_06710 [Firmicutes bacterium]|nr:hypothetical protein [Bacillota bacterium]